MRAEVRDDAAALITPFGIADQPCRSVPVEHAAVVDRTEFARGNQIAHAHEMRLEAVVVGGVDKDAARAGDAFELGNILVARGPQRLFDEDMLAVLDAGANEVELRLVRNTGKDGVVAVERYVAQVFVVGLIADRIDRSDVIAARKPFSFATLDA